MTKTILVTGASGFIGGRFAYFLACQGFCVLTPLRHGSSLLISHPNIRSVQYSKILPELSGCKLDQIIHCAALTTANSNNFSQIEEVNISLASLVCEWISIYRPEFSLFLSTVSIYGSISEGTLCIDTTPINPNLYGKSKLYAENMIRECCRNKNVSSAIFRLPGTVGYGSHGNIISKIYNYLYHSCDSTVLPLTLFNPNSLFNNIVNIESLMQYWNSLSIAESSVCAFDILTLLASSEPILFNTIPKILSAGFHDVKLNHINWSSSGSASFVIDVSHAISKGFLPLSTSDSLKSLLYDMHTFHQLLNE